MDQRTVDRVSGSYKRSHSMESWFREREEDLALFHDMQARERSTFLYPSNEDIEASLSTKFGEVAGDHSSIVFPIYQPGRDLLTADADKHDYDWLLTPPGTPLFPSLDQDTSSMNLPHRSGISQLISSSRTSRLSHLQEPHPKMFRRSQSPCRPSTASSTSSTRSTIRGRTSSPSCSPNRRTSAPSTRLPTLAGRVSGATAGKSARPSMPTLFRTNTSPIIRSAPAKARSKRRGGSLSPKLQACHPASLPEFSSQPPPNLRISMSDWNSRHGSAAGTRNSPFDISQTPQKRRQPVSPNTSRSSSSFFSQDRCSSQTSRGSGNSSCDDDEGEIARPALVPNKRASMEWTFTGMKWAVQMDDLPGSKYNLIMKRQIKQNTVGEITTSTGPLPRKLSESRQMEHQRPSQNMFRPLLSSVPASSFYSTKCSAMQFRPSSSTLELPVTGGSNTSSEYGLCIVPDNESGDVPECKDSDWDKQFYFETQANGLVLNRLQVVEPNCHHGCYDKYGNNDNIEHVKQNIESTLDLNDLPQHKNGTSGNEGEIDMSITQSQNEVYIDRHCDRSSVELQNENISMLKNGNEQADNWFDPGLAQDDLTSQCKEDSIDHIYVDIEEDLSIETQKKQFQDSHFLNWHADSFHSLKLLEDNVPQMCCLSKIALPIKQEIDNDRKVLNILPSKQDLESMLFKECNLDLGLEQPTELAERHLKELYARWKMNRHHINEDKKYKGTEHNDNMWNDGAVLPSSFPNLNSSTSILPHLSYGNRVTCIDKSESTTLAAMENGSANVDTNLSVQNGAHNIQSDLDNVGLIPVSFVEQENKIGTVKQAKFSCSISSHWIKEYDEGVEVRENTNMHDKPIGNIPDGCFRENIVGSLETLASSECGLSKGIQSSILSEELTVSSSKSASREKMEGINYGIVDDLKSEACYVTNASEPSSLSYESEQSCNLMMNSVIDKPTHTSPVQHVFEISNEDVWQTCSSKKPEIDRKKMNDCTLDSFMPEQEDSATAFSIDKLTGTEETPLQLKDITHGSSESDKEGSNPLEEVIEVAACGREEFIELTAYLNDAMQDSLESEQLGQEPTSPGNFGQPPQGTAVFSRVSNLKAARDTVTFCSSIVHEIMYRAVAIVMEKDNQISASNPDSTREELLRHHRSLAAGYLSVQGESKKGQRISTDSTVCRTLTYVKKKQKMVLHQTPMVTHKENPVEKTGTAVLKGEDVLTTTVVKVPEKDNCKSRKVKCRCKCSIM